MTKRMVSAPKLILMAEDTLVTGVKVNEAAKGFTKAVKGILTKVNGCLI